MQLNLVKNYGEKKSKNEIFVKMGFTPSLDDCDADDIILRPVVHEQLVFDDDDNVILLVVKFKSTTR